ncbi:amino acid transporter [Protomyces lactucae-debilis]|uniref:Amino acid transporter n=1 Tax=Protomyces lactucae-debilis TaxID=2754530 RepID=A0A1Y2FDW0_PROLT|nr:amino acid transporter [Protomyces lactucae-debilis]ORY82093.1 amino acid transporter [Protomyces lactucae-debilis]
MGNSYELQDKKQDISYEVRVPTDIQMGTITTTPRGFVGRMVDSFKPPLPELPESEEHGEKLGASIEGYDCSSVCSLLLLTYAGRHMQMIAIGGSIGTGLFVGSGKSLVIGGPASVVIAFILIGVMLFNVVHALGELAVMFPIAGSFATYNTRFLDPAWGFAMGYNYAMNWLVVLPLELSAASIVVQYWNVNVNVAVFITLFLIIIVSINLCGVRGYGDAELIFSSIKVLAVTSACIIFVVINVGGTPAGQYLGAKTWSNPGAFNNGFHGLCGVFVNAAFSFGGTELVGLAAAEAANPRRAMPKATKQVFWRITIFYVLSLFLVGLIVPFNDPRLTKGASKAARSPFVIAMQIGGIKVLPSIFNAVILISVLSVGNSSTYGSSRTLAALAKAGQAPKWLGYIDRKGRPMAALGLALFFGLLGYVNASPHGGLIFDWLLAISSLSSFFTWGSICLCHIRFRKAWRIQGHSLKEIPFRAAGGVYGSWFGLIFNILCLVATFYVSIWPPGNGGKTGTLQDFFINYLAVPVILLFYFAYKLIRWKSSAVVRSATMDVTSGRRSLDLAQIEEEELYEAEHPKSAWKKLWSTIC